MADVLRFVVQFFQGRRRRLGLFTLLLAILFTSVWLRSSAHFHALVITKNDSSLCRLASKESCIIWEQYDSEWPMAEDGDGVYVADIRRSDLTGSYPFGILSTPFFYTLHAEQNKTSPLGWPVQNVNWHWHWCGFGAASCEYTAYSKFALLKLWTIPYWVIVLMFTFISAFLFAERRTRVQKNHELRPFSD